MAQGILLSTVEDQSGTNPKVVTYSDPLPTKDMGGWSSHAEDEVLFSYGDIVKVKPKSLLKFGENTVVGTAEATVMEFIDAEINETYVSTNAITSIISDGANTQDVRIEGHTISGNDLTFVVQTVTLTGTTAATLGTALARVSRISNEGSTALAAASKVYVYEGGAVTAGQPDVGSTVHIVMSAGEEQSLKASTSLSSTDYAFITDIYGSIEKQGAGAFATIRLKVRRPGGVFQTKFKTGVATDGASTFNQQFEPYLIVPKNSDIIITAEASTATTAISAGWNSVLAAIQ